jgi:hypothetical protein
MNNAHKKNSAAVAKQTANTTQVDPRIRVTQVIACEATAELIADLMERTSGIHDTEDRDTYRRALYAAVIAELANQALYQAILQQP